VKHCRNLITLFPHGQNIEVVEQFRKNGYSSISGGGNPSSKAFLVADLMRESKNLSKVLWISGDLTLKETAVRELELWGDSDVFDYTTEENPIRDKHTDRRNLISTLDFVSKAMQADRQFFVVEYHHLFARFPRKDEILSKMICIEKGMAIDSVDFFERLIEVGYEVGPDISIEKGQYFRQGDHLWIFPVNTDMPYRVDLAFDEVEGVFQVESNDREKMKAVKELNVFPLKLDFKDAPIFSFFGKDSLVVDDEVEFSDDESELFDAAMSHRDPESHYVEFRSFMEETPYHHHLHYLSVIKHHNPLDFVADLREKLKTEWTVFLFTKHPDYYHGLLKEKEVPFVDFKKGEKTDFSKRVVLFHLDAEEIFPEAFQNPALKFTVISDRNIAGIFEEKTKNVERQKVYLDFLTGLKAGDFVVHSSHGVGQFFGLEKRTVDKVTREYLKVGYAENDKLFVPIDQADRVSKFIGSGDKAPKLTRLGSAEWTTIQNKVRAETESIARELLELYAEREGARGFAFSEDNDTVRAFENAFHYEPTPGQLRAILDVKKDMEAKRSMDRLVCGDVGFGKTEVAMRAAFKAVQSKKQVAVLTPITILADQHYKSFKARMDEFNVRVEVLSRFKSQAEQTVILKKLERGEVDIVIGTHRLLQPDVRFKDLGLVVVDEEQRFGVKQKEYLKELRKSVDILTLTATPIPRTLNIGLHGLRDISTITTPPPGRLPIVTEVRRFSFALIKQAVERELERGGQVYFLHNRVQTIDDMAGKLQNLLPKARVVVTHGQLKPDELERRILAFKNGEFDILVSSTIIENGIDLPNANTLIVNQAEKFGLAQLYQLRGRVGRGRTQAYAYFLYHMKRLPLDAKKRLRAIVEASELGAGFQIAMKDLEIRGAGDILGANQSGAIQVVGVSHFVRMLHQAVEQLKSGKKVEKAEDILDVSIEVPLPAYIPDDYIVSSKEKISVYQKLASADSGDYLMELRAELVEDYGKMPEEVNNLFRVLEVKILAKRAGIVNVKAENLHSNDDRQIVLTMSGAVTAAHIMNLLETNDKWLISGTKLKIKFADLGVNWVEELKRSLSALGKKAKNLPGTKAE